jgi:putative peptidoglycan lipid II flippase
LTAFLAWASISFDWLAMRQQVWGRLGTMALVLIGSALLYFACLRLSGLRLQSLLRR